MNRTATLLAFAALVAAVPATAQESARNGSFEFRMNQYRPNIDAEFGGAATPYADIFGTGDGWMFRGDVARSLVRDYGTLDLGLGIGWYQATGKGLLPDGTPSADRARLRLLPVSLSLTYRLDQLANRGLVPLAPYVRVAFERYHWWTTNGADDTSELNGRKGRGATHGYSVSGGVALLLDFIDRQLAREADRDTGINHTYLYFDVTKSWIDDFGSKKSFDLSQDESVSLGGGLLFVY